VKYQSITFLILDAIQQSCKTITAFFWNKSHTYNSGTYRDIQRMFGSQLVELMVPSPLPCETPKNSSLPKPAKCIFDFFQV
jgi:hypothetical protein